MVDRRIIIGGAVIGAGALGYMIYRYEKNKQAAATTAAASGYGYGSTPYGYGASAGYGTAYGYGFGYGLNQQYGYGVPYPPPGSTGGSPATTNAEWAQAAIGQLSGEGFNPMNVTRALGAYLNGVAVDPSQVNIIDSAIGVEGYPPQAGTDDYPPKIKTGGTTGGGQGGKVNVPSVVGKTPEQARSEIGAAGLKDAQIPANVPHGLAAHVTSQSPRAGRSVNKGSTVTVHVTAIK